MTLLTIRDVVQTRGLGHRAVTVLEGISVEVDPGEQVLLTGPSGSGKTTLLAVAAGLLTPKQGDVVLAGHSLPSLSQAARCRIRSGNVGFVFQRANLLSGLTVVENVTLAGRLAGMSRRTASRRALKLLEQLGVEQLVGRSPRELSGGEEQRVAVARALVHNPVLVLADEPTGNLDSTAGEAVAQALSEAAELSGCAMIVATHDVRLAAIATRRFRLQDGRLTVW
jgi:putative ABC transport system ATP-binding protein